MWVAYKRGEQYHNTGEVQERKKVTVTPEEVMRVIEQNEEIRHEMKESLKKIDALELVYEDDLRIPEKAAASCEKAFHFLGVDPMEVQSKFRKVSTGRLSDDLENAEEIYEFIKNSKYAHFLGRGKPLVQAERLALKAVPRSWFLVSRCAAVDPPVAEVRVASSS